MDFLGWMVKECLKRCVTFAESLVTRRLGEMVQGLPVVSFLEGSSAEYILIWLLQAPATSCSLSFGTLVFLVETGECVLGRGRVGRKGMTEGLEMPKANLGLVGRLITDSG